MWREREPFRFFNYERLRRNVQYDKYRIAGQNCRQCDGLHKNNNIAFARLFRIGLSGGMPCPSDEKYDGGARARMRVAHSVVGI